MKPLTELTRLGVIRRYRNLARAALDTYGLNRARLTYLTTAGNVLFRVDESTPPRSLPKDYPFEPGRYLLRIHDPDEQATDAIQLEMSWLAAIRRDTGLPVPEPVSTPDGRLTVRLSVPGIPESKDCTLLRWLKGRRVTNRIRPHHFRAQGRVMAQLHHHASHWTPAAGLTKRRFDYDGLFNDDAGAGMPNREAWKHLPERHRTAYEKVARKTRRLMDTLGQGQDVFSLIHGDCGVDANVLFWKGNAHIIDFDGSGFGYYAYDLALALEHCWDDPAYPRFRQALLEGYAEHRVLPEEQVRALDLFRAAFYGYMGLWTVALDRLYPDSPRRAARHAKWLDYGLRFIEQYLKRC